MRLTPTAVTKQGEKLLSTNPKFWVLFIKLVQEKITDENRKEMREMVMNHLKTCQQDMEYVYSELGSLLEIQDDKENLPNFGGLTSNI